MAANTVNEDEDSKAYEDYEVSVQDLVELYKTFDNSSARMKDIWAKHKWEVARIASDSLLLNLREKKLAGKDGGGQEYISMMCPHPEPCVPGWPGSVLPTNDFCPSSLCDVHCGAVHGGPFSHAESPTSPGAPVQVDVQVDEGFCCATRYLGQRTASSEGGRKEVLLWDISSSDGHHLPASLRGALGCTSLEVR